MLGQGVSSAVSSAVANAYPSNDTPAIMSEMALLGIGVSLYARRVHHWAGGLSVSMAGEL